MIMARPLSYTGMQITYIGHATLLIEIGGVRILTDPNFENHLGKLLPRVSAPGITLEDLPPLNALLLTHAHADHLSFKSLDRLPRDIPLYAPKVIAKWLRKKGYQHAIPLDSGDMTTLGPEPVRIHADRATHQGSRYGVDRWRAAANMYLIETDDESVFFAGDTALTRTTHRLVSTVLSSVGRRLDIALLPIGYAPRWKPGFRRGHLTSEDALQLFEILGAPTLIPYHWGTFRHITATAHDAINRLRNAIRGHAREHDVCILQPGESFTTERVG